MAKDSSKVRPRAGSARTIGAVAAACGLCVAVPSSGQAKAFTVPAECGDELEFHAELERLAGVDAERARPSLVRIERDAASGTYHLTLDVAGRRRELEHADCRVLVRSAAVIAAASVKADASAPPEVQSGPEPAPSTTAAAVPAKPREAPAERVPAPRVNEARAWRGQLALGGGVALGVVPALTPVAELRGGVSRGVWGATLAARYFAPQSVTVEGRSASIRGYGLRAASVATPTRWLAVSLGLDLELLVGHGGDGVALPATDEAWTVAPSGEIAVIPLQNDELALELGALGRVAVVRPVFEVGGFGELYRVPSWGMTALARGVWRFR